MSGPTYVYTPDVPQGAQPFNTTQAPILSNFRAINELFAVNHVGFNSNNAGKHSFINLQFQGSDPSTGDQDLDLYTKATGSPNAGEIFYRYPNNGTVNQLTPVTQGGGGGTSTVTFGSTWCLFPSGVLMKWGTATIPGNANYNIPSGSGVPAYTQFTPYFKYTYNQSSSNGWNLAPMYVPYNLNALYIVTGTNNSTPTSPSSLSTSYLAIGI